MDEAGQAYRDALLAMARLHREHAGFPPQRRWNRLVTRMQWCWLDLRDRPEATALLHELVEHDDATVRSWSAVALSSTDGERARSVLRAVVADDPAGLHAFEAEMTLAELEAGRLRNDWVPTGRRPRRA